MMRDGGDSAPRKRLCIASLPLPVGWHPTKAFSPNSTTFAHAVELLIRPV